MLAAGAALLLGAAVGFGSLYAALRQCERATATVRSIQTKRVYRARKLRYDSRMLISYPTERFGLVSASVPSYCPFRREGDRVVVWYHPDRPRDIRRPLGESCIYGMLVVAGLVCVCGGMAVRKEKDSNLITNQK